MKKKNIEERIKKEFRSEISQIKNKIIVEDYLSNNAEKHTVSEPKQRRFIPNLRIFAGLVVIITLAVVLVSINYIPGLITTTTTDPLTSNTSTTDTTSSGANTTILNPVSDITALEYANPIITASKMTFAVTVGQTIPLGFLLDETIFKIDDELPLLNQYVNALETSLFQPLGYTTLIGESDNPLYMFMIESYGVNLIGTIETYRLYYNVDAVIEDQTEISGIVQKNGTTSLFEGTLIDEGDEKKFIFTSYETEIASGNYVVTEFIVEDDEQTYHMDVYQNNQQISSSDLSFRIEDDETKINVLIEKGTIYMEFEIEKENENGIEEIKISYSIHDGEDEEEGEIKVTVLTDPITGNHYYQYNIQVDGNQKSYNDDRYDNDDDDDHEEDAFVIFKKETMTL